MRPWEIEARESIRDLVARCNANGDSGHIDQLLDLFAPDAMMVAADMDECRGRDEIRTIFTRAVGMAKWEDHPVEQVLLRCPHRRRSGSLGSIHR